MPKTFIVTIEFAVTAENARAASEAVEAALEAAQNHLDRHDIVDHTQFGSAKEPGQAVS